MAGISIPGVSDKYKTNDLVENLMKVERIPLTREQETLEKYKHQQESWRAVNQKMASLRDSVKTLYSFDNPFNNKLASSTQDYAITASAGREAAYESFKIDVIQTATSDRFLSTELEKGQKVPAGTYTYKTGDKTVSMKWKGGKVEDFVTSLNKRGKDTIKASLIGVNRGNKALLIESLKTGSESHLIFEEDALNFAIDTKMIQKVEGEKTTFGTTAAEVKGLASLPPQEQEGMPLVDHSKVKITQNGFFVPERGGFSLAVPKSVSADDSKTLFFTVSAKDTEDITVKLNEQPQEPVLPAPGNVTFKSLTLDNNPSSFELPQSDKPREPLQAVKTDSVLYAKFADGTEKEIPLSTAVFNEGGQKIALSLKEYPGLASIELKNTNTGRTYTISKIESYDANTDLGYTPLNAVSSAGDAIIKYEGITITRPTNKIDDVIPHVTLDLHDKTDKTATIKIEPDTESAKDALINFVGKYNQTIAEINILSQNKGELISELDYLSADEKEEYKKKLGLFFGDMSLTNVKAQMQQIIAGTYNSTENSVITMLSQIGISTNATSYSGYNPSKMRGYLEINEKVLDQNLAENLDEIKKIFGYDSDGDLIVDTGIGYLMDKQLTAYVQSGGILAIKNSTLDKQIKASESKISKLETQLDTKEAQLRQKYGQMESTLNSLEGQQNAINNFNRQNSRN